MKANIIMKAHIALKAKHTTEPYGSIQPTSSPGSPGIRKRFDVYFEGLGGKVTMRCYQM